MAHALFRDPWSLATAAALACLLLSAPARADVSVSGNFAGNPPDGDTFTVTFSCIGSPTCNGAYTIQEKLPECSNLDTHTDPLSMTLPNLSHAGPITGTMVLTGVDSHASPGNGGPCTFAPDSGTKTLPYTGSWDGSIASISIAAMTDSGLPFTIKGTFTASGVVAPPVFPMNVTGNVGPTITDIDATIQPKAADAGTTQKVFVFAHAPSTQVSGASPKAINGGPVDSKPDDAVVCVLAQVTSDGRLVAVSASTMQAYLTGVISSQGQAVQILNNVATSNVAGAAVYVGYGASAAQMLSSGVYQGAVTVPGPVQCTTSLAAAPAPNSPAALSGLWWNAAESGWGVHFTQRGKNLFAAWYTYDANGNPKWYVAPNCGFTNSNAASGNCTSPLYEVTAAAYIGHDFNPNDVHASQAGTLALNFTDANNASLNYTVGSQSRTVAIVRQVFPVAATATPAVDFTDLWWNPNESGWGMAMAQQFGNVFLAWYVYDATGKPFWYVAPACTVSGSSCSGALYRTTGPAFGPPLDPAKVAAFQVGSAIVSFVDANNAVLSYTVDGVSATKVITRQLF